MNRQGDGGNVSVLCLSTLVYVYISLCMAGLLTQHLLFTELRGCMHSLIDSSTLADGEYFIQLTQSRDVLPLHSGNKRTNTEWTPLLHTHTLHKHMLALFYTLIVLMIMLVLAKMSN